MKKAMLMGVSGAALLFAATAHAEGYIAQGQDFEVINSQAQKQGSGIFAGAGDGGDSSAKASGGDAGGSGGNHHYSKSGGSGGEGGFAKAKAEGGDGGLAKAKAFQKQGQDQYVSGSQSQVVKLPDIHVDNDVAVPGGGGAAGPGGASGSAVVEGDDNEVQTARAEGPANVANLGGIALRADTIRDVQIGDGTNVLMRNVTNMDATNQVGPITLSSGDSVGGYAEGGDLEPNQTALTGNLGRAGDAYAKNDEMRTGSGGDGGKGTAVSANLGLNVAASNAESEGGDGKAYSSAKGYGSAGAYGKAGSGALAGNKANTKNFTASKTEAEAAGSSSKHGYHGSQPGNAEAQSKTFGKASTDQNAESWAQSWAKPTAKNHVDVTSGALGQGGDGGDVHNKTSASQDQAAHSAAAGGAGGNSGDIDAVAKALGGDLTQSASSKQVLNAATGATQGGNGGNIAVTFGTGAIGAMNLGTVSGIATVAQNTGLSANQFTSFSINANASF